MKIHASRNKSLEVTIFLLKRKRKNTLSEEMFLIIVPSISKIAAFFIRQILLIAKVSFNRKLLNDKYNKHTRY
jgi:hypothetical protein